MQRSEASPGRGEQPEPLHFLEGFGGCLPWKPLVRCNPLRVPRGAPSLQMPPQKLRCPQTTSPDPNASLLEDTEGSEQHPSTQLAENLAMASSQSKASIQLSGCSLLWLCGLRSQSLSKPLQDSFLIGSSSTTITIPDIRAFYRTSLGPVPGTWKMLVTRSLGGSHFCPRLGVTHTVNLPRSPRAETKG